MRDDDYLWDPGAAPDPEIVRLEDALRPLRHRPGPAPELPARREPRRWRPAARLAAAAVVLALAGTALFRSRDAAWTVRPLRGEVVAGGDAVGGESRLRAGEWVETDHRSAARIRVGRIGRTDLGPGTRARLVRAAGSEHRMAMEYGTLRASIWAPPRFFLVETPSALAIDLGCVYTLRLDERGTGFLRVESGRVELVHRGRRVTVLAGNQASLAPGVGPGIPFPSYAGPLFRAALRDYEAQGTRESLRRLLQASGSGTTLTLWHLLQRVPAADRAAVYDRLAEVAPEPPGAARAAALRLDAGALEAWREALEGSWTRESVPAYRRAWRKLWADLMN